LVTKERSGYGAKPTYESLEKSLIAMREHMVENQVKELAIPQIGCGLDGLKWDEVSERLNKVFDDTDIEITVYIYVP
jgi:O-acetyl-ADP-ribose deacetylase (regulator of RNase III)